MQATPQPILPQSLPDQIADWLVTEISEERLLPEQRLTEQYVAEQCRVSRGPVRDAFRIVEKLGLIRILPRKGVVVSPLDINELKDLFEIRAALVHVAVCHIIDKAADEELQDLLDQARSLEKQTNDENAFFEASNVLGSAFVALSHSRMLRNMLMPLEVQVRRYRHHGFSSLMAREASAGGFVMMAEAMLARDKSKVQEALITANEKLLAEVGKTLKS